MPEETIIKYDDPEAATYQTNISGWVSRLGHYYGKSEHMARWDGCTHNVCDCGKLMQKGYVICTSCRDDKEIAKYKKLPTEIWDEETPITMFDGYEYFNSWEDVFDYLDNLNEMVDCEDDKTTLSGLMLCHTKRISFPTLDIMNHFDDCLFEDADESDIPQPILDAVDALNKVLEETPGIAFTQISIAVDISVKNVEDYNV